MIELYIGFSLFIGYIYFQYWKAKGVPEELKNSLPQIETFVYIMVFVIASILAPLSIFEMIYSKIKNRKEKRTIK